MKDTLITPSERSAARDALLDHYDRRARDLPWRRDTDPYRVLVSEIMLQQTRVDTVMGYYGPWLERFPTIRALAEADEDTVLKAWEGLGYYRRARNLHLTARVVREEHGGVLPSRADALRELPGVGAYTAGAVASIAFGEAVPAVDGNVRRVLARLHDVAEPGLGWLRDTATEWVDHRRPGDWNQALMELGATICTPRVPACSRCPVGASCRAREAGTAAQRPRPTEKRCAPTGLFALAVLHHEGRVLLEKRPTTGLLAGMWAFPERRVDSEVTFAPAVATSNPARTAAGLVRAVDVARSIAEAFGVTPVGSPAPLGEVRHRFTHLEARYLPVSIAVTGTLVAPASMQVRWVAADDDTVPLPVAQRSVLESWVAAYAHADTLGSRRA
jgi:A/G-specific adenine glycosylase